MLSQTSGDKHLINVTAARPKNDGPFCSNLEAKSELHQQWPPIKETQRVVNRTLGLYQHGQQPKASSQSYQSPHRISAGGSLLFMRCVSLTLTGLVSAWRRREAPSTILVKPLSDCVTVFCLRQCKSRHLNVCEILKKHMQFSNKLNILHS